MAEPTDAYPAEATNGARPREGGEGEAALREVLDEHGEELAVALEQTDEVVDLLETTILMIATADEEEIEYLTDSSSNLIAAADGISTAETAEFAADVGENADDLANTLATVLALQRDGHLDDFVTIATAFSESLSPDDIDRLANTLEANGDEMIEALDVVLELQRDGHLEDLVELTSTLSTLEIDAETAQGLNALLGAVGEANRTSEPVGVIGTLRTLGSPDLRAGLGYLLALLKAQGRRLRQP